MQTLYFEDAWDKTIAPIDRKKIIEQFNTIQQRHEIELLFLWQATNYKDEQLITALIHNATPTSLTISETPIAFSTLNGTITTNLFHLPVTIPANTSMPWTFIFSEKRNTEQQPHFIIQHTPS